jgi:hypothetical protein
MMPGMPSAFPFDPPCPCGSEAPLSRCCSAAGGDYTQDERHAVAKRLADFGARAEFAAALRRAGRRLWVTPRDEHEARLQQEVMDREGGAVFAGHLFFDALVRGSGTLAHELLRRQRDTLPPRERGLLAQYAAHPQSLYRIEEVFSGQGLRLRDLLRTGSVRVRERTASTQLEPDDTLLVRVIAEPDGTPVLEPPVLRFDEQAAENLDAWVLRQRGAVPDLHRSLALEPRPLLPELLQLWLQYSAARLDAPLPQLVNHDQEVLVQCTSSFAVADAAALQAALAARDDFDRDGESWVWHRPLAGDARRTLGRLTVAGDRVSLETNSRQRAARGRELLEQLGGAGLRFLGVEEQDGQALLQRARERGPTERGERSGPPLDPEERREVVRQALHAHVCHWLDQPQAAFDGRTPRAMAAIEPKVVAALLWKFENNPNPELRYDAGWIHAELGLPRHGAGPFTAGVD